MCLKLLILVFAHVPTLRITSLPFTVQPKMVYNAIYRLATTLTLPFGIVVVILELLTVLKIGTTWSGRLRTSVLRIVLLCIGVLLISLLNLLLLL